MKTVLIFNDFGVLIGACGSGKAKEFKRQQ